MRGHTLIKYIKRTCVMRNVTVVKQCHYKGQRNTLKTIYKTVCHFKGSKRKRGQWDFATKTPLLVHPSHSCKYFWLTSILAIC